jgi:hypothetical protein
LAIAVAQAILDDRQNPGADLPFQPHNLGLLARLGIGTQAESTQQFLQVNRDLDLRLAEYCWRLVGLGFLVPQMGGTWGVFHMTGRGRAFLSGMDPTALVPGALDTKLAAIGFAQADLPRQYARLAQDCFLAGHYEASVVMLGVATEALILDLAQGLSSVQKRLLPRAKARPGSATARRDIAWIGDTLQNHRADIKRALVAVSADDGWIEPLRDLLAGTAQAIRLSRNDFGHPTGITTNQEDALQLLSLFPRFAAATSQAREALALT